MTGAMYAAISGLKAHMNKLNVIGNNIANVNTYGYKTQRAIFSDSIYYFAEQTPYTADLEKAKKRLIFEEFLSLQRM